MGYRFGNLVVALAALGLAETAVWWFGSGRGPGYLTLLGGVIAAYSLDRLLDAPASERRRVAVRFAPPLLAGAALVCIGLWRVPAHLPLVALLGVMGGAYVPLKRYVPKGVLTAGAWSLAVTWLPSAAMPSVAAGWPVALCVFLVVGANAILCDALDVEADRRNGVRGLGPWLGARGASAVAAAAAAVGGVLAVLLGPWPLVVAAVPLLCIGLIRPGELMRGRRRPLIDLMLVLPGVLALCLRAVGSGASGG